MGVFFPHEQLNIADKHAVESVVNKYKPDVIINTAAFTSVDLSEREMEEAYIVNSSSVEIISVEAEKIEALVIHFSTDYIFSGERKSSYTENDIANPMNIYGASKLAGEVELRSNSSKYLLLRTSWVFSEFGNNFVKKFHKLPVLVKNYQLSMIKLAAQLMLAIWLTPLSQSCIAMRLIKTSILVYIILQGNQQ